MKNLQKDFHFTIQTQRGSKGCKIRFSEKDAIAGTVPNNL